MFLYKHTFLNVKYIFSKILQRCLAWCFFWKDILKRKRNKKKHLSKKLQTNNSE